MAVEQAKKLFDILKEYFDSIEESFGHDERWGSYPYRNILGGDVCKFLYYMAASDGNLDVRERNYINAITGYGESQSDMMNMIQDCRLVTAEDRCKYKSVAPNSFVLCLWGDQKFAEQGYAKNGINVLTGLFRQMAIDVANVDGVVTFEEQRDMGITITMFESLAKEELAKINQEEEKSKQIESIEEVEDKQEEPEEVEVPVEPEEMAETKESVEPEEAAETKESVELEGAAETKESVEPETVQEKNAHEDISRNDVIIDSVEGIIAEMNCETGQKRDRFDGLEISIGENGGSYIAITLSSEYVNRLLNSPCEQSVPAMICGNYLNVAVDNHLYKKDLFTGELVEKETDVSVTRVIHQNIIATATHNSEKIEQNKELMHWFELILDISENESNIDEIGAALESINSRLTIKKDDRKSFAIVDENDVVHSVQEAFWLLSF